MGGGGWLLGWRGGWEVWEGLRAGERFWGGRGGWDGGGRWWGLGVGGNLFH